MSKTIPTGDEFTCNTTVYHRDQYRIDRGRGFKMHYSAENCKRKVKKAGDKCWQHKAKS